MLATPGFRASRRSPSSSRGSRWAGQLSPSVHEDFTAEYEREKAELNDAISALLTGHPEIRREELLIGERQVLRREKSAVMDAMRAGVVSDDVGERLLDEVDLKLDRVHAGESTVAGRGSEGYEEFWRRRAEAFGLDVERPDPE